jgi:hypothetical protein
VSQKNSKLSRRHFLLTVGAGGAATAAVIAGQRKAETPSPSPSTDAKRASRGYQETAHVANYYRTAKV